MPGTSSSRFGRVQPGDVVAGKFRIDRILGEGGMGVVVAATHLQLDEPVALKFLLEQAAGNAEAIARFTREAKAAAKLKSEHVAHVIDFGVTPEGTPYIVMEYLQGHDLSALVKSRGPLDVQSAVEYIIQACEGLAEAHARGIVHRDIKPENLFLVDREMGWRSVKILDFGISKVAAGAGLASASNISTQSIMGSPCYMSPEQLRSTASVDHRTDIWSLGATLYELLAGRTAYDSAKTLPELIAAILDTAAPPLAELPPYVPPPLAAIVARCMEKERDKRFGSTADLAVALLPFAPKRARTAVERAMAMSQSAGMSRKDVDPQALTIAAGDQPMMSPLHGLPLHSGEAPTLPPPPYTTTKPSAVAPPPAAPPLAAPPPTGNTLQQMATVATGDPPVLPMKRPVGAIVGVVVVVTAIAAGAVVWVVGRGHAEHGTTADTLSKPDNSAGVQHPATAAASVSDPASPSAAVSASASSAVSAPAPSEGGSPHAAASASAHHPTATPHTQQTGSPTPEPRPTSNRDLDIRTTR
jgi:serine/threonine-protein kinase